MLKLNESEIIDSWDVVVKTSHGRELSCVGDLDVELPFTATQRIDFVLEEFYPCEWAENS